MKNYILILSIFSVLNIFGQDSMTTSLVESVIDHNFPKDFEQYLLFKEGLEEPIINDSLQKYQIRELKLLDNNFPLDLIYKSNEKTIDWTNYSLKNVKYLSSNKYKRFSPPLAKSIIFVKYNISHEKYDSILRNKKRHSIVVKKKLLWNKNKIWENKKLNEELVKAWEIDEEINEEDNIYFQISKPIFSKDYKYAKTFVFENHRCKGEGYTLLYRYHNESWKMLLRYNFVSSKIWTSHAKCGKIQIVGK
ncbi:hypothetical protein [Maribacter sp.]|uniref:hypothetical protein n=1 Tax=Maribacter sp. TaxID=1897614 RepID=UPI0025BC08E2|nr:hypothetical protein [Maribacter sp.]